MYQKTFFSLSVYNKIEWKGPPRKGVLTNSWVLSEPQEIVAHHTAHQLHLPLWETRSGQVRITYNTRLYEGRGWWVRNVFNMILFPYLFDEKCKTKKEPIFSTGKCESVLSTFSIPLYQNDQKGRRACFLFSCSISSISAPLVVTYVEERFGTL